MLEQTEHLLKFSDGISEAVLVRVACCCFGFISIVNVLAVVVRCIV